jgi:putative protein kinase ArgK-like GTPase of G3E family
VLLVSARDGTGIDSLIGALAAHREALRAAGEWAERRRRARVAWVQDALERRYGSFGIERIGGREAVRGRAAAGAGAGFEIALVLGGEIEAALR